MLGIGQSLGNYRIVGKLGSGGMGVVYEAEHPLIGKRVALKVIHKDLARNHEVITRFFNEARAVNQIGNDHVVDVSDFGQTEEGEYFLVMEVLVGESLADRLERERRLPVGRALHVAAQIADGLSAAHAAGVVHRDLKPDNVFLVNKLGDADFVKILDFGLAKLMLDGGVSVTKQGVILGTPEYMSPEQAESKRTIDHRSDVYALGILLYQMTTGLLPFVGNSMGEVLVKHVSRAAAPPRGVNPEIPAAVEQIILKCLAKRPEERFQGMGELRAALLDPDRWTGRTTGPLAALEPAPGGSGGAVGSGASGGTAVGRASGGVPVLVPPQTSSPVARTLIGTGVPAVASAAAQTAAERLPALRSPTAAQNSTVVLPPGVAAGRAGRARRRRLASLAFASLALVAGVTWAMWRATRGSPSTAAFARPAAAPSPSAPAPPAAAPVAPATAAPAPAPLPATVRIVINTQPSGAEIFDEISGRLLGVSPTELQLPRDSGERALVIRHVGCGEKRRAVKTTSDAEISLDLERLPRRRPTPTSDLLTPRF